MVSSESVTLGSGICRCLRYRKSLFRATSSLKGAITSTNHTLVKEGWCWWYRQYAPGATVLEGLETEAREQGMGCGKTYRLFLHGNGEGDRGRTEAYETFIS